MDGAQVEDVAEPRSAASDTSPAEEIGAGRPRSRRPSSREGAPAGRVPKPRARPPVSRIRSLPSPWRWLVVGAIALGFLLPVAEAVRALDHGWHPVGDVALIGIRADDVFSSPPTLGQPTSAETIGAERESNHLGPIESYLLAPPMALLGPRLGLALGAALINGAAWALALFLAHRRGGMVLLGLVSVAIPLLVRSVGPSVLHDPINSDIATLALIPLALAAWSMLDGDLAMAPLLAFLATLVLQPHLSNAAVTVFLVGVGTAGIVAALRRRQPGDVRWVVGATVLLVLLWLPPILHELGSGPSNLAQVWGTLWEPRRTVGVGFGLGRAANAVAPWLLPFFARAHQVSAPAGTISAAHLGLGLLVLGLVGFLAVLFHFAGRHRAARLLAIADGVAAVSVYATSVLPWGGVIRPEHGRWVWLLGALVWVGLAWSAWWLFGEPRQRTWGPRVVPALLVLGVLAGATTVTASPTEVNTGRWAMPRIEPLAEQIRAELPKGSYELVPLGGAAFLTVAPGLLLELERHGYRLYVPHVPFNRGYDDRHFYDDQPVRGTITLVGKGQVPPPDDGRLVVRQAPLPGAALDGLLELDVYYASGTPA